ncbi:MOSC domain-containing protein [Methylomarinum vadi]|uniref:MOSC domain-containing protein n=1 Tax=Methylomarinum vadi TaxID=438855 RepID=UPI0004DFA897|nr:MOSC N-terminal beta barrel domain-containing protein [Methylomarinum vadi]
MNQPFLSQIYLYPVKSLGGIRVERWPVDHRGLVYDRKWMLIDRHGRFLSQRRLPKMALIKTQLTGDQLVLTTPDQRQIALSVNFAGGETLEVSLWHDLCQARTISDEADRWLSDFLDHDCRLVYQPDDSIRPVDPHYALASDQAAFSDGFPFLIVSEASLQSLNKAMQLELSMSRFRPNLVIDGCAEYAEDGWREISIGHIGFRLPKPCSRCNIPAIDPETADIGKEPLQTLNRLRKWNKQVYFGQNALHNNGGELTVGSPVTVTATGTKQPPLQLPGNSV